MSSSDRTDETNFQNPKFFGFGVPVWVVDIWELRPRERTPSECSLHFPSVPCHWFALKLFLLYVLCRILKILNFLVVCHPLLKTYVGLIFSNSSLLPTHLCICHRDRADMLYITGVMVHSSPFRMSSIHPWTNSFLAIGWA